MALYDPITQTKLCKDCGQRKPVSEFYKHLTGKHAQRPDPYHYRCRDCTRIYSAERYKTDPRLRERVIRYGRSEHGLAIARAKAKRPHNRARDREYQRRRMLNPFIRQRYREWLKEYWQRPEQKAKAKAAIAKRRALRSAAGGSFTQQDIERIRRDQKNRCAICRKKLDRAYHIDHINPIARGGNSNPANLQLLCPPCNHRKSRHDPILYMQSLGRLI